MRIICNYLLTFMFAPNLYDFIYSAEYKRMFKKCAGLSFEFLSLKKERIIFKSLLTGHLP